MRQNIVVPGLRPKIDHIETRLRQRSQFFLGLVQHIGRPSVGSHPLDVREVFLHVVQELQEERRLYDQRVPVREEHAAHILPVQRAAFLEVPQDLLTRADPEPLVRVHVAECALVVRAADRHLNDQAPRLAWWPVKISLVLHALFPFRYSL